MNEEKLKKLFEKSKHEFKDELQKEFSVSGTRKIDYISKKDDLVIGIEVKGSRSDLYGTIGQLFFFKKFFSHLYILAPLSFIKKITQTLQGTPLFNETGFLTINEDGLVSVKEPEIDSYYFQPSVKVKERKVLPRLQAIINENDIEIIKRFQNTIFTAVDISKEFNISRENSYRRINRLKKAGVIEELDIGNNPKTFKITKYVDKPVFISNA